MSPFLKLTAIFILFVLPFMFVHGQFNKGFVVTNSKDTIHGYISPGIFTKYNKCVFKKEKKSAAIEYSPYDIMYYETESGKFTSHEIFINNNFRKVFCNLIFDGRINLYYNPKNDETRFFVQKKGENIIPLTQKEIEISPFETVYRTPVKITTTEFKDTLRRLMSDCEKLQPFINNVEYTQFSLIEILKAYHKLMENDENYYIPSYYMSKFNPELGFYVGTGMQQIKPVGSIISNETDQDFHLGGVMQSRLPFIGNHLALRLELKYSLTKNMFLSYQFISTENNSLYTIENTFNFSTINVPLSFRYYLLNSAKSPYLGIGITAGLHVNSDIEYRINEKLYDNITVKNKVFDYSFYNRQTGWFIDLGYEHPLNSSVNIFSNIRLQYTRNLIISGSKYNGESFKKAQRYSLEDPNIFNETVNLMSASASLGINF